jgi:hypothetical protein
MGGQDAASGTGGSSAGGSGGNSGAGGSSGAGLGYANIVLSDGPSLYWRELAGTGSLVDASPKGNDGTYVGCVQPAQSGAGPTVHLCGGYLQAGDIFDFPDAAPFSFEAWIKPESVQLSKFARIVGKENPVPGTRHGWDLILIAWGQDADAPSLVFERWGLVDGSASSDGLNVADPDIPSDRFTHVAVTFDGATCRVYLNGVSALEGASPVSLVGTTGSFRVGADPFGQENWRGDIDEIAVYEKALPPARVAAHYDEGKAEGR